MRRLFMLLLVVAVFGAAGLFTGGSASAETTNPTLPTVSVEWVNKCQTNGLTAKDCAWGFVFQIKDEVSADQLAQLAEQTQTAIEVLWTTERNTSTTDGKSTDTDAAPQATPTTVTGTTPEGSTNAPGSNADASIQATPASTPADCPAVDGATAFVDGNGNCTWNGSAPPATQTSQVSTTSTTPSPATSAEQGSTTTVDNGPAATPTSVVTDSPTPNDGPTDQQAIEIKELSSLPRCDLYQTSQDRRDWTWNKVSFGITNACTTPQHVLATSNALVVPYGDSRFIETLDQQKRVAELEDNYGPGHYTITLTPTGLTAWGCQLDLDLNRINRTNMDNEGPCGEAPPAEDTPPPVEETPPTITVVEQPPTPEAPPTTVVTVPPTTRITTIPVTGMNPMALVCLAAFLLALAALVYFLKYLVLRPVRVRT